MVKFWDAERQTFWITLINQSSVLRIASKNGRAESKSRINRNKSQIMCLCFSSSFSCQIIVIIGLWLSHATISSSRSVDFILISSHTRRNYQNATHQSGGQITKPKNDPTISNKEKQNIRYLFRLFIFWQ